MGSNNRDVYAKDSRRTYNVDSTSAIYDEESEYSDDENYNLPNGAHSSNEFSDTFDLDFEDKEQKGNDDKDDIFQFLSHMFMKDALKSITNQEKIQNSSNILEPVPNSQPYGFIPLQAQGSSAIAPYIPPNPYYFNPMNPGMYFVGMPPPSPMMLVGMPSPPSYVLNPSPEVFQYPPYFPNMQWFPQMPGPDNENEYNEENLDERGFSDFVPLVLPREKTYPSGDVKYRLGEEDEFKRHVMQSSQRVRKQRGSHVPQMRGPSKLTSPRGNSTSSAQNGRKPTIDDIDIEKPFSYVTLEQLAYGPSGSKG